MPLVVGDILAVLFSRSDIDTFHWSICVPVDGKNAAKYHAKGSGNHWWFDDPITLDSLEVSSIISAAVKIGSIEPQYVSKDVLKDNLETIPMVVPDIDKAREPKFTCRVWFREAIRVLHKQGIINCTNLDNLEQECKTRALPNQAAFSTWSGYLQYDSKYSS